MECALVKIAAGVCPIETGSCREADVMNRSRAANFRRERGEPEGHTSRMDRGFDIAIGEKTKRHRLRHPTRPTTGGVRFGSLVLLIGSS